MDIMHSENKKSQTIPQAINALVAAAGEHDKSAEKHSERVTRYSIAIGRILNLSSDDITTLKYAASLHDIGKIAVSRRIINKLGKLSKEEFEIMKQHSVIAIRILEKVEALHDALPLVRHHHERFDGKGYPDGLIGDDIPLGSRIIAVAEAFDILTSSVPWRHAMNQEDALKEIHSCSNTQFDPDVVNAFTTAITNGYVEL